MSGGEFSPEQVIRAILEMRIDLLWNGGIGTYVKASTEDNREVGDFEVRVYEGAGHFPMLVMPEELNRMLLEVLAELAA